MAIVALLTGGVAHADRSTTLTAEGGAEADTNVERVETGPGLMTDRIAAPVGRLGAKVDHRDSVLGGAYVLHASALARVVGNAEASPESVALLVGDLRWIHPVGERPVSAGFGLNYTDALPLADAVGSRTFRTLAADGLLVLRGRGAPDRERTLTIAAGLHQFTYKPSPEFQWLGPALSARLDLTLWQASGGTRSLELAAQAGIEARAYDQVALADACPHDMEPADPRDCPAPTSLLRRDRYHRIGVDLTWTGSIVATVGYQVTVTDSNSFGQSFVRHRVGLSATKDLPWQLYGTVLATLQLDQYLDGLIVQEDVQNQTFTTLDDENRSSLQGRLARPLSKLWSLESRVAVWRNLGSSGGDTAFRRALFYLGVVYSR
ncbi:MAG TPA: hypothetical protein VFQ53_16715 [Kofleriaceae bacterium]|nr:hypothetical protein [Kofleriaceae bacterium]